MKSPQNTTGLCDQCQTIPLWDLPPFQLSDYTPGLEQLGKPHYLNLIRKDDVPAAAKPIGFHWHQDRGGLWQSAAGGCPLCRLVDKQARLVLSDLDGGDHFAAVMGDKPRRDNILRQVKEKFKARLRYDEKEENQDDDNVVTSMSAMMANESNVPLPRPSFDLWLTNRGSSGAGLMVFSTSIQEPGVATEKRLIPIAIIGFCSDPGDPLSEILPGRTIEAVPGPSAFAIANNWLEQCNSRHRLCSATLGQLPDLLLDLGEATTNQSQPTVRLCKPPDEEPLQYVALSYCHDEKSGHNVWKNFKHSLSNMGSNPTCAPGEHVKYENLCRVFQDAIVATRRLGLRYLWIDSLCIPGGDEKAWTRDSENLAMVYRNAYLVISATGASDPSKGLFEQRTPKHYEHFSMKARSADGSYAEGNVAALSLPLQEEICGRCPELRSEPLSQRAWAFQERVLARRILHFTRDQLRFECIGGEFGMMSEDGTCSALPRFFHLPNRLEDVAQPLGPAQLRDTVTGQVPPAESTSVMQLWSIMLLWYSSLDLADPLDRLPAIAQTARAFREMVQLPDTDSDYLAGIWRSHLIDGLMWECMIDLPNIHSTEIRDGTPSWSWASVTGPVHNMLWTWGNYNLIGEILEAYTDVADPRKPFGKVTGGFIKLRAPTIAVSMVEAPFPTGKIGLQPTVVGCSSGQLQVKGASFDTIDDNFDRSAEKVRQMKLFVVFLANSLEPSRGEEVYHGLLVTLANDDDDSVLKRVGTYILTSKQVLKLGIDLDSLVQTITLV
ncbi:hypothetical protein PgNI_11502 [Pyricularia grisea]|uniref:Heterokaryon incompatibility domain-containing protein n=1 Tax=Pyricularia grisea TaxID=148305 RepID=A0A6P8APL9_PYRGI|nr:hypothetical protein PgNI_11502 [Pyricularia grisea]TLD03972.1 hypothetical protein PgNI_11502 [Pyricularia grisea]